MAILRAACWIKEGEEHQHGDMDKELLTYHFFCCSVVYFPKQVEMHHGMKEKAEGQTTDSRSFQS